MINAALCQNLDDDNWLTFNELGKKQISKLNILPAKDIHFATECDLIQNYLNSEKDEDILLNHVNSIQFNSMKIDLPTSFGPLHTNIASLNLHIDDLKLILSRLNFKFDIIGICEHKIHLVIF